MCWRTELPRSEIEKQQSSTGIRRCKQTVGLEDKMTKTPRAGGNRVDVRGSWIEACLYLPLPASTCLRSPIRSGVPSHEPSCLSAVDLDHFDLAHVADTSVTREDDGGQDWKKPETPVEAERLNP